MTTATVATVVESEFPDRTLTTLDPVSTGNRRTTVVARFAEAPPLVAQCSPDATALRLEATLTAAIRDRTDVPVPPTLAVGTVGDTGYAVRDHRPGSDLHTELPDLPPERRRAVVATFGRYLGDLHAAFTFDGCGPLGRGNDGDLTPTTTDCRQWLATYGQLAVDRLPSAFDSLRDQLLDCLRQDVLECDASPTLFPWDFRPGNALVDDGKITAVVDWEEPLAAPPALAVAKVEYLVVDWYVSEPASLREAFRRGYQRVRPVPTVRPIHRAIAIADSAVDSQGRVTNIGYPERDRNRSVAAHRRALVATCSRED